MSLAAYDRKIFVTRSPQRREHNGEAVWVIKQMTGKPTEPERFLVRFDDGVIDEVEAAELRAAPFVAGRAQDPPDAGTGIAI